jgi:hypothetical protein
MRGRATSSMLTELLGLPGAGKSTLEREIAAWGTVATIGYWRDPLPRHGVPMTLEFFLRAPLFSAAAYLTVVTRRGVTAVHLRQVTSIQRRHFLVKKMKGTPTVLDEGPVHSLFQALYGTDETALSRLWLRLVLGLLSRQIGSYFYLDTPKERCIDNFRQTGRTSLRFNANSSEQLIDEFRRDRTYEQLLSGLRSVGARLTIAATPEAAAELLRAQMPPIDRRSNRTSAR